MIEKVVVHTIEKSSKRRIPMVVLHEDARPEQPYFFKVLFATEKPNCYGRDLLTWNKDIANLDAYHIIGVDVYTSSKHRYVDFSGITQLEGISKIKAWARRFITSATTFSSTPRNSSTSSTYGEPSFLDRTSTNSVGLGKVIDMNKYRYKYDAVLITNSKHFASL